MTSQEFLRTELKVLAEKFPNVKIKYGFNHKIEAHIVELLPLIEYNNNKTLDDAWISISLKFYEEFINEEVVFVSSDSSLCLKQIIFEFNSFACTEENIITELFSSLTKENINYTFSTLFTNGKIINKGFIRLLDNPAKEINDNANQDSYLAAA